MTSFQPTQPTECSALTEAISPRRRMVTGAWAPSPFTEDQKAEFLGTPSPTASSLSLFSKDMYSPYEIIASTTIHTIGAKTRIRTYKILYIENIKAPTCYVRAITSSLAVSRHFKTDISAHLHSGHILEEQKLMAYDHQEKKIECLVHERQLKALSQVNRLVLTATDLNDKTVEIILAQSDKPLPFLKAEAYQALTKCFDKYLAEALEMPPKRDKIFYGATVTHSRSSSESQQSFNHNLKPPPASVPSSSFTPDMVSSLTVNPHLLRSTPYSTPTPKEGGSFSFPTVSSPTPQKKSCCCNKNSKCNIL